MIELAERYGVLVLEDDPYGEIYFGNEPPAAALRALSDQVVYLGSFSKTIAPGIRVGWIVARPELISLLFMAKEGADIHSNRVMMRTVYHAATGFLDAHVGEIRSLYRARRDALYTTLSTAMPVGVSVSHPDGGFFIWCELPEGYSADDLLRFAADFGVGFLPGSWFYPSGAAKSNGMRLSYSSLPVERIREGAIQLGEATTRFLASRS
jgi:2-aminoadipate transaminase